MADDLYVASGFIDSHSYCDLYINSVHGRAKIMQGVTTEIVYMDDMSVAPIKEADISG